MSLSDMFLTTGNRNTLIGLGKRLHLGRVCLLHVELLRMHF